MQPATRIWVGLGIVVLLALAIAAVRFAVPSHARHATAEAGPLDPHLALAVERDAAVPTDAGAPSHAIARAARVDPIALPAPTVEQVPTDVVAATRATFCPEAAARLCRARERCGCSVADPGCVARVQASCGTRLTAELAPPPDAPSAPSFESAPEARDACLAALDALGEHCDIDRVAGACAWPVREGVGVGEACARGRGLCRDGICGAQGCERLPTEGEPASALGCAPGLAADPSHVCRARGARGASCTEDAQCEPGLRCRDGLCDPGAGRMEPCPDGACAFGLACSGDTPDTRRCITPEAGCSDGRARCAVGYACDVRFTCTPSPGAGSSGCIDGSHCPPGTACQAVGSGRCEPALCRTAALTSAFR